MYDHDGIDSSDAPTDERATGERRDLTFENGTYIVYERANAKAWVQADSESTVTVEA